jgi:hypothetical protein
MPRVAEILVREAVTADLPQIAAVALATGQDEEWGGGYGRAMLAALWPDAGGRRRDREVLAAGTVGGAGDEFGVTHLAIAPAAEDGGAVAAVLASLRPQDGLARACLPAPHPAVRPLLAGGGGSEPRV